MCQQRDSATSTAAPTEATISSTSAAPPPSTSPPSVVRVNSAVGPVPLPIATGMNSASAPRAPAPLASVDSYRYRRVLSAGRSIKVNSCNPISMIFRADSTFILTYIKFSDYKKNVEHP